jgi:hypothetical protein
MAIGVHRTPNSDREPFTVTERGQVNAPDGEYPSRVRVERSVFDHGHAVVGKSRAI